MSKKTEVSTLQRVTLKQAADLICATPSVRYLLISEPGIGKSSLLRTIQESLSKSTGKEYLAAYIDVPNLDLGDIAMPVIDKENKTTSYYPNARFRIHEGQPVVIMLDEFSKGADPVKNMLHPLLEVRDPRLGDVPLPEGSIIFLTGNLNTDGVGDSVRAHTINRITPVVVRKPDADSWIAWAMANAGVGDVQIAPEVVAWVKNTPHALASYLDQAEKDNNPYIFNPKLAQRAFVSPRSLERASAIVNARKGLDYEAVIAALSGTVGESAARDMVAYFSLADQLPMFEDVIANPTKADVPDSSGAIAVFVYGAVVKATLENFDQLMTYVKRLSMEWQAVFCVTMVKTPSKQRIIFNSESFKKWADDNKELLS